MDIELCHTDNCTGCGLCVEVCPHKAISFKYDDLGFRYPQIDFDKCVSCGSCIKKCPILSPVEYEKRNDCYLAWAKDNDNHYESASGGVAYTISKYVIDNGGFAVGCVWDEEFNAVLKVIERIEDLKRIRGSKYVQSYIPEETFKSIKKRLINGERGIFIGLPCQVAAIKSFVSKNDSLVLCDLLCHGGCSPTFHKEHIASLKKKNRISSISDVRYRGGDYDFCISLWHNRKMKYVNALYADTYYYAFVKHALFHESCYTCQFARSERVSDITIADFWGLDPEFVSDKNHLNGTNLVLVHSSKGEKLWKNIETYVEAYRRPFEEAVKGNDTLRNPTEIPNNRQSLLMTIERIGFEKAINNDKDFQLKKKNARRNLIKHRIILMMPKWLKKMIKAIIKF